MGKKKGTCVLAMAVGQETEATLAQGCSWVVRGHGLVAGGADVVWVHVCRNTDCLS
jgi:hypothetical protein